MQSGFDIAKPRYTFFVDEIKRLAGEIPERLLTSPQGAKIMVRSKEVLNFSTNDYLSMCNNAKVKEGAIKAIESHGFGVGSVRLMSGTQDIHKKLEKELAEFTGTEDCILFSSCYDANGALFDVALTDKDAVISDELNHASIIDGIRLCKAKRIRYKHLDMVDLEKGLQEAKDCQVKMIATDAAFSMDGDIAPLPDILKLAKQYGAMVMIDESHSSGVFGKTGRGVIEHFNVMGQVDIITSTLGKALGGATGGFICGRKEIIAVLRVRARPYIFSNSIAPPVIGGSMAALGLIKENPGIIAKLQENTAYFRNKMLAAGYQLMGHPNSSICPALLKEEKLAYLMAEELLKYQVYVMPVCYPVVPKGTARIRITITAGHSTEDLDKFVSAFDAVMKSVKAGSKPAA